MDNLAVICPDVAFKIEYYDTDEQFEQESGHGSAVQGRLYVMSGSREDGYVFVVNRARMQEAWLQSVLKDLLEPEAFMTAFIVSELSVLKYEQGSFSASRAAYRHSERLQKDEMYYCVYHSLLRKFSEYRLARELPEFGKLLALLILWCRWRWPLSGRSVSMLS